MGEGLRNTVNLRGRAGAQGFLHWSGNFDEVQDFEGQIRALAGGTGLMSDAEFNTGTRTQTLGDAKAGVNADLDALAAYVASLSTFANSPHRNADGSLTAAAVAGREVFRASNCAQLSRRRVLHRQRGREPAGCRHDQARERQPPRRPADGPRRADAARCVGDGAVPARRFRADDRGRGQPRTPACRLSATDLGNLVRVRRADRRPGVLSAAA